MTNPSLFAGVAVQSRHLESSISRSTAAAEKLNEMLTPGKIARTNIFLGSFSAFVNRKGSGVMGYVSAVLPNAAEFLTLRWFVLVGENWLNWQRSSALISKFFLGKLTMRREADLEFR